MRAIGGMEKPVFLDVRSFKSAMPQDGHHDVGAREGEEGEGSRNQVGRHHIGAARNYDRHQIGVG